MKKSSRQQAINDFPPLAFELPLELVPLASPPSPLSDQEQLEGEQAVQKTSDSEPGKAAGRKKRTKRAESKGHRHPQLADELSVHFSPRYRHEWVSQTVTDEDGTTAQVKVLTRVGPHPGVPASEGLRRLIQWQLEADPSATQAQLRAWIRSKASPLAKERIEKHYQEVAKAALAGRAGGDCLPLFRAVACCGPRLLMNPEINAEVERWWFDLCDDNVGPEARELAKHNMESLCVALTEVGQGRITTISPEEREQIIAAYQKWRPICEELNKSFKEWWQDPKYCSSELHRKEIRGTLAENLSILVEDVEAIEWSLKKRSPKGGKSTPSQATCHRVAREFPRRGEKTIEEVWGDYVRNHPEESRKRRKISTTPVAERTA